MDTSFASSADPPTLLPRSLRRRGPKPPLTQGFLGPGHTAVEVLRPTALEASDPFVLLMDDRVDFAPGQHVGGAHPHAGLETVTFVVSGSMNDRDEGLIGEGDVLWMNAGSGIIHNEHVDATGAARILQLWITLPVAERRSAPSFELVRRDAAPVREEPGVSVRLYSGRTGPLVSPTRNRVPITLVDIRLAPGASVTQELPASYRGFAYLLEGSVEAGDDAPPLGPGEVGWLDETLGTEPGALSLTAGPDGARLVLYAGEPQRAPVVQHGPFVAGSMQDISALHVAYRAGKFTRMSTLAEAARALSPARPGPATSTP